MANLKIARVSADRQQGPPAQEVAAGGDRATTSGLDVFATESGAPAGVKASQRFATGRRPPVGVVAKWIGVIALSATVTAASIFGYARYASPPSTAAPASVTLHTIPPGLEVSVGGRTAGVTPLTVSLPAGDHHFVVSGARGQRREVDITLKAGETVVQHLEMASTPAAAVATSGSLRISTEPPRQAVTVDGIDRGLSPVTVASLAGGTHVVVIRGERGTIRRNVTVEPGQTLSLVISPTEAPVTAAAGWLRIASPVVLQLKEDGKLIGSTETERLMIAAGEHQIEMANDAVGYRTVQRIVVAPGKTTEARVQVPNGLLSINAQPWAEVWIDGERVGETPIANLSRPLGIHDVVLRHPQFGERTASITVSLKQTARLGVDMRKP